MPEGEDQTFTRASQSLGIELSIDLAHGHLAQSRGRRRGQAQALGAEDCQKAFFLFQNARHGGLRCVGAFAAGRKARQRQLDRQRVAGGGQQHRLVAQLALETQMQPRLAEDFATQADGEGTHPVHRLAQVELIHVDGLGTLAVAADLFDFVVRGDLDGELEDAGARHLEHGTVIDGQSFRPYMQGR